MSGSLVVQCLVLLNQSKISMQFFRIGSIVQVLDDYASIGARGEIVGAFNFASKLWPVKFSNGELKTVVLLKEENLVTEEFMWEASPAEMHRFLLESCPKMMAKNLQALAEFDTKTQAHDDFATKTHVFATCYEVLSLEKCQENISDFLLMISSKCEFAFSVFDLMKLFKIVVSRIKQESESFRWLNHGEMTQTCLNLIETVGDVLKWDCRAVQISEAIFDAIQNAIAKLQSTGIILVPNSHFLSTVYSLVTAFCQPFVWDLDAHLAKNEKVLDKFLGSQAVSLLLVIGIAWRNRLDHDFVTHDANCTCCDFLAGKKGETADNNIFLVLQRSFSQLRYSSILTKSFSPKTAIRKWIDQQVTLRAAIMNQNGIDLDDLCVAGSYCPEEMMQFYQFLVQFDNCKIRHLCSCCGVPIKSKCCGRCRQVWYCSRDCQIADWSTHRQVCKVYNPTKDQPSQDLVVSKSQKRRLKKKEKSRTNFDRTNFDDIHDVMSLVSKHKSKLENMKGQLQRETDAESKLVVQEQIAEMESQRLKLCDFEQNAEVLLHQGDATAGNSNAVQNLMMTVFCRQYLTIAQDIQARMKVNNSLNPFDVAVLLDPPSDAQGRGYTIVMLEDLNWAIEWCNPSTSNPNWKENLEVFTANIAKKMMKHQFLVISPGISYFMFPMHDGNSGTSWNY